MNRAGDSKSSIEVPEIKSISSKYLYIYVVDKPMYVLKRSVQ